MDSKSFTELFNRLKGRLHSTSRRILGNDDDADDALQDAFCAIWTRHNELEASEAMATVAVRNRSLDTLRRRAVRYGQGMVDSGSVDIPDQDNDNIEDDETFTRVQALIDRILTHRDARILIMRDYEGAEISDIAIRTGVSETNVRVILSRSRKAVRLAYLEQFRD